MIFIIVLIHESGHFFFAKIFKRRIVSVSLLPFGGLTKIDAKISEDIWEDLLIAVGGIFFQSLFGFILIFLYNKGGIEWEWFKFLSTYNVFIITFNLLPICPLDGYKMLRLFSEIVMSYKLAFALTSLFSIATLITMGVCFYKVCMDNIFVMLFLVAMIMSEIRTHKYACLKFYLERMNYDFHFARADVPKIEAMYKNRVNYIDKVHEKKVLRKRFTSKDE